MVLRDALALERTQGAALLQTMPTAPPPSLEQGKGATFDAYA